VIINCYYEVNRRPIPCRLLRQNIVRLCEIENAKLSGEIRIIFVDDQRIQHLNEVYLQHDYPTDVIAFSLAETAEALDGEVYVSVDRAADQAQEYQISIQAELWRLVIHGVLHLLGYNDQTITWRQEMSRKEDLYLTKFDLK